MEREAARYLPASPDPDLPARLLLLAAALAVPSAAARNGTLDAGFGAAGYLADVGASDLALGLAFEATGRVVLAGTTGDVDGETTLLDVARFLTDGRPAAAAPNGFGAQTALTLTLAEAGAARVTVDALGTR